MIEGIGNAIVALDAAHREDIELLRDMRQRTENTYRELIADLKTVADAADADFAKAIARREHMLGEQPMQYQQAAE